MAKIEPHFSENRQILADVVPLSAPYCIQCEVSQLCNIACNYCIQSFGTSKDKCLMDYDTFCLLCDRISQFDVKPKQFNFAGWGEPLVNPRLPDMIRRLSGQVGNIAIVTNGILLSKKTSRALVSAGTDQIRISLQGMTLEKYREICGKTINFQQLVKNIGYLYENKRDCKIYVKIADTLLGPDEEQIFYDTFDGIADRMYVESIRPMFAENQQDGRLVSRYGVEHSPVTVCPQPFYMMSVTATGDILPCCSYYDPTGFGNIKDDSLRDIWESLQMGDFWWMLLNKNRRRQNRYLACRECLMPDATLTPEDNLDVRADEIRRRL